jgi:glycosyltransferase involved in cell wall biosynthesis
LTRILHIDHAAVLGGAERSVLELAAAQRRLGDDALVAVGSRGPFAAALEEKGVPCIDLHLPRAYADLPARTNLLSAATRAPAYLLAAWRLRRAVSRARPDVVQVHTRKAQLLACVGLAFTRTPSVWHLRDGVPGRRPAQLMLRAGMRRTTHAVALSRWLVDAYAAAGFRPRSGRIGIVPSGVDGRGLSRLPTPWLAGERGPAIGFVGQITAWKGPHLVLAAFERLEGPPDSRLVICGEVMFPAADGGYGASLDARIAASPRRDSITRLRGLGPCEAFAAIDLLAHASTGPEPFGRVIVEALAAHRPVVAFPQGAPLELLEGGVGVLAERADATALSEALAAVLADRKAAARMAALGSARAAEFEPDRVAAAMALEYEALR